MSNPKPVADEGNTATEGTQSGDEFVPKRAYEEVSRDMHKFKADKKAAEARAAEYEAKLKAAEEEKMREANQYKELYERTLQEKEISEKKARDERNAYLNAVKKSALKAELGGRIKDVYLVHADLSQIEITDDGVINPESLLRAANEFRKNHGELIPPATTADPTAPAAPTGTTVNGTKKSIEELTLAERVELLRNSKPTSNP